MSFCFLTRKQHLGVESAELTELATAPSSGAASCSQALVV